jgi:hypothetical protein
MKLTLFVSTLRSRCRAVAYGDRKHSRNSAGSRRAFGDANVLPNDAYFLGSRLGNII